MTLSGVSQVCCRVLVALALASSLSADVIFERALPTANLNNAAGADRSNISWAPGDNTYILGDDFTLASDSVINSFSVWEVSNNGSPTTEFGSLSLYVGSGPQPLIHFFELYALAGVRLPVSGLQRDLLRRLQDYVLGAQLERGWGRFVRLRHWRHSRNREQPVPPRVQCRSQRIYAGRSGRVVPGLHRAPVFPRLRDRPRLRARRLFWDKGSDINVEIDGSAVPEPATFGLLAISAGALLFLRRRRA
jgi:hypothetical protein